MARLLIGGLLVAEFHYEQVDSGTLDLYMVSNQRILQLITISVCRHGQSHVVTSSALAGLMPWSQSGPHIFCQVDQVRMSHVKKTKVSLCG